MVNPRGKPVQPPAPTHPMPIAHPTPPIERGTEGVGVLMIASLPTQASGADVYARQFYRGSQVPFRRYLPIAKL
ncbi:MAG TPA: hypothetical protein VL498_06995 [Terracidiphilus sp.]|jgi:hypothetical protein|nr:hypothetical protein [Terracidiphilus sp.]